MSGSDAVLHDLMLACARPLGDPYVKAVAVPLLEQDIDVDRLITQAGKHRLLPLMYAHLRSIGPDRVPDGLMERLFGHFHGQALRNHRLTQTLAQTLKLFEAHGVPVIPWKGPVLAKMAYGDINLRPFTDLDLIVPEAQIERAKALLCDRGYRPLRPMTKRQDIRHRRTFHAYTLLPKTGVGCIDLHWRITQHYLPFPIDMDALWTRLDTLDVDGLPVRCLSAEDTLLLLCVHGTVNRWAEVGWISDLASLVNRATQLDWEAVFAHSRCLHSERMVLLGLNLCHDLLGTELPAIARKRLGKLPLIARLCATIKGRLWHEPVTQWERLIYYGLAAQGLSRFSDRLRFWQRTASWALGQRLQSKAERWLWQWRARPPVTLRPPHDPSSG